jgi:hypothetical protein
MFNSYPRDAYIASGPPEPESSWNFIPADADASSALTEDPELERYLVEEIARATRRRPLMKRLAHVEAAYAELPGMKPGTEAPTNPPPLPSLDPAPQMPAPAYGAPIHQLMEDFREECTTPPASAEWLDKAQRDRRRARLRTLLAWIATLAIGAAIIAATLQAIKG